jgi:predicted O-linked N-acetylglucosamine transferase (SPINDLY family)
MTLGLPESGFVFCCFNNAYKILPATFDSWMRIMRTVDGSVLWLMQTNATATSNLRREAERRGVDGSRLLFAPLAELHDHLARYRQADLFLDTAPYNAHTTASDALWAGVPVLTLIGRSFASRVAASLLQAVQLPELIAGNAEQYEAMAIELAMSPAKLGELKSRLQKTRVTSPLFDGGLFARNLEAAFEAMHARARAGLPPSNIDVPA